MNQRGAVALLTVIIVTSVALVFAVSLAIMNVDYKVTSGIQALEQELVSATDSCLEQGISAVLANSAVTTLNVNDIGPGNIDCQVAVTSSGNLRHLLAQATSSGAFYNAGKRASTTVDLSTNPPTVVAYNYDIENRTKTLAYDTYQYAKINISYSGGTVVTDGIYLYLVYIDTSNSNKVTVARYEPSTLTVIDEVAVSTSGTTSYPDAVIHRGYIYYSYGMNNGSLRMAVGRIALDDFSTDSVTNIENPYGDAMWDGFSTAIAASGDYVYTGFTNSTGGNNLEAWQIDINDFSTDGMVRRQAASNGGNCYYVDGDMWNEYFLASCRASANGNQATIYMIDTFDFANSSIFEIDTEVTLANYGCIEVQNDKAYVGYTDANDSNNLNVAIVDLKARAVETVIDTNTSYGHYCGMVAEGTDLYVAHAEETTYYVDLMRIDLIDNTVDEKLTPVTARAQFRRIKPIIIGDHLYYGGVNASYWHAGIVRVDIE